jgi:vitamin B12/bleomycin/antimicrobial peptide transport system ATP-binding/permease protein
MDAGDAQALAQAPIDPRQRAGGEGAFGQMQSLLHALWRSPYRRRVVLLAAGAVAVICANMVGQVRLNAWQGDFFNALEQQHRQAFLHQALVFLVIIGGLLILVVAETWLREMLKVRLREWLAHDLLDQWLIPKRAYLLPFAGQIGTNPDQRMQADALHLTELSVTLTIGLLRASLLLISFAGVLWVLSAQVVFAVGDRSFSIPGYMVWCALAYAIVGSWFAWRVGRPLIPLNAERYAREADFRFALVRANEFAEGIALHGGEADERRILNGTVSRVVTIMTSLANKLARLTWVTSGFGWLALIVPVLVAAPGYFGGGLSFGGLMMVVGAFNQVQEALRWFVDNFPQIADWRATLLRVVVFRDALVTIETLGEDAGRIRLVEDATDTLRIDDLSVALADGEAGFDEPRIEIGLGEHILILGEPGAGKSTLFRAMAGLWPWGSGTIHLPPRAALMFMPARPYLPLGTLRAAVSYPADSGHFDEAPLGAALTRVGLAHLVPALDREQRWDRDLSLEEQQRLAFARVLVHAPRWLILDDAVGALDHSQRDLILSIFDRELSDATVINIGRSPHDDFYHRTLHLVRRSRVEPRRPRAPQRRASLFGQTWGRAKADVD